MTEGKYTSESGPVVVAIVVTCITITITMIMSGKLRNSSLNGIERGKACSRQQQMDFIVLKPKMKGQEKRFFCVPAQNGATNSQS